MYHQYLRAIANGDRVKHHRLVVQPAGTACDWSTGGATTHEWWCDHTVGYWFFDLVIHMSASCDRRSYCPENFEHDRRPGFARKGPPGSPPNMKKKVARFFIRFDSV